MKKPEKLPLSERPFVIGYKELCSYLGVCMDVLRTNFLDAGLKPKQIGKSAYFYKRDIDLFIDKHNEWQEVKVR